MKLSEKGKRIRNFAIFLVSALVAVEVLCYFAGSDTLCFWRNLWGIPCPGCGLGRAFLALGQGNIAESLRFHALLPVILLYLLLWLSHKIHPWLSEKSLHRCALGLLILLVGYFVLRMIWYFPDGPEPVCYSKQCVSYHIYQIILK